MVPRPRHLQDPDDVTSGSVSANTRSTRSSVALVRSGRRTNGCGQRLGAVTRGVVAIPGSVRLAGWRIHPRPTSQPRTSGLLLLTQ